MNPNDRSPAGSHEVVDSAITSRRSIRAFLPTPVPRATIEEILAVAARAPSGTNTQPWKVAVLTGAARQRLVDAISAAYDDPQQRKLHVEEYAYYRSAGTCTRCSASGATTRPACTHSMAATTGSSMRQWA